ncbi:MAG: purine-nucleoside phosphorylase [Cyclobacteriaceae bacterium]|nr:purine-nucleoside phosphorylase [Cyclobacteriaceae bacterium]
MKEIEKVKETVAFLTNKGIESPSVGIILGTGLGSLADHIEVICSLDYTDIPHFPLATIEFHQGKLIYGTLEGKKVLAMQGRFHYYEGYNLAQVVFPVRVMALLGISQLIVSNAGGNLNTDWKKGQIMLINDHINLLPDNPLRGNGAADFGNLFVDMAQPYNPSLNNQLREIAREHGIRLNEGVYTAVSGPNLETRAEYRYLRRIGADVVGMSTVPEVIAANQLSLPVCALSVLTDDCDPDHLEPVNIADILHTAKKAEKDLVVLVSELVKRI